MAATPLECVDVKSLLKSINRQIILENSDISSRLSTFSCADVFFRKIASMKSNMSSIFIGGIIALLIAFISGAILLYEIIVLSGILAAALFISKILINSRHIEELDQKYKEMKERFNIIERISKIEAKLEIKNGKRSK